MRHIALAFMLCLLATPAFAAKTALTEDQKTLYALGYKMMREYRGMVLSPQDFAALGKGVNDGIYKDKPEFDITDYDARINELYRTRVFEKGNRDTLAKAEKEPGAVKLPSGVIIKMLREGSGANPAATDTVKVNYRGTLVNGREFDSSYKRGEPATFPLDRVIQCWTEGVQKIKTGGKALLTCPSKTAYGDSFQPSIPKDSVLVFEVELLDIVKP